MRDRRGLTLIEVMVSVVILGIIMAGISQLLGGGLYSWQRGETRLEAEQNARLGLERIKSEAQRAMALDDKSSDNKIVLVFPDNVEVSYYIDTTSSTEGPGGLSGYALKRDYTRYSDEARNYYLSGSTKEIAGYLQNMNISYHNVDSTGNLVTTTAVDTSYLKINISCALPSGEILELNTGIALRGKSLPRR